MVSGCLNVARWFCKPPLRRDDIPERPPALSVQDGTRGQAHCRSLPLRRGKPRSLDRVGFCDDSGLVIGSSAMRLSPQWLISWTSKNFMSLMSLVSTAEPGFGLCGHTSMELSCVTRSIWSRRDFCRGCFQMSSTLPQSIRKAWRKFLMACSNG